tara:strand:+ start:210 stop:701 length:492 start_codon:yes stop_codon:yes gene_type:complete
MELDLNVKKKKLTHRELCEIGAKYLRTNCGWALKSEFVLVEMVSACIEQPDIFGIRGSHNIMIEVKVSRSDFKADFKKPFRNGQINGIGATRYYLCPTGLIKEEELPEKWGLIYCNEDRKFEVIKFGEVFQERNFIGELNIMKSVIRRINGKYEVLDFRKPKY